MKNQPKFPENPERTRRRIIVRTAVLSIISNVVLASVKISIGMLIPSVAILSEGINNLADSLSSVITILGIKLSERSSNHKFTLYAEGFCGLIISLIILYTGIQFLRKSVLLMFYPQEMRIAPYVIIIMGVSAVFKIFLSRHTIKQGKRTKSTSLIAIGIECRNDFIISAITLLSCILFVLFNVSADAYAGIISAGFILKSDIGVLLDSIKELRGS
ncbi:MAG: cation diffusion facilitator family transporter [Firmicutes bacterium]|nr:cation diffusion facilitator family transporter [Bacillota bacterium]